MHCLARHGYLNAFDKMFRAYPYFDIINMPAEDGQTPAMLYAGSKLGHEIINAPLRDRIINATKGADK